MIEAFCVLLGSMIVINIITTAKVVQMFIEYEKLKRE